MVSDKLWNTFFNDRSIENRNAIVKGYIWYVHHLVNKNFYNAPEGISKEDLIQSGRLGLIEAVERFNPINGNKFETYAKIRIQGAVYDYIRYFKKSNLGISRTKSSRIREIIETKNDLEQSLNRTPTKQEIANALGMEISEYEKILQDKEVKVFYEDDYLDKRNSGLEEEDRAIENPEEKYLIKEEKNLLQEKMKDLNDIQQKVLRLYYYEERSLKEIGEELALTESRISQIHKKAIYKLRFMFDEKMNA